LGSDWVPSGLPDYFDGGLAETTFKTVTGQSLADVFHARIFDRLDMEDTYLVDCNTPRSIEPLPFYNADTQLSVSLAMTSERGTGGAVSTMTDTLRYLRAYFDDELFIKAHDALEPDVLWLR
jgi:D-alanyl-D-alanine carboxypeptidase